MSFDWDVFFKTLSVIGGGSFFWKLFDLWQTSQELPHVTVHVKDSRVVSINNNYFITFDLSIKNTSKKKIVLVFSRLFASGRVESLTRDGSPTLEEYLKGAKKINTAPQAHGATQYRHKHSISPWAEFVMSPLGSNYIFEPGEEWGSNFMLPVTSADVDHIVHCSFQFFFCERKLSVQIIGIPGENNADLLKAVDPDGTEYEGENFSKLMTQEKVLAFSRSHSFVIPGTPQIAKKSGDPKQSGAQNARVDPGPTRA